MTMMKALARNTEGRSGSQRRLEEGGQFRRLFIASLESLAQATAPGGGLTEMSAFMVVTIFHRSLHRLGFETDPHGPAFAGMTAIYQCALLASLHPDGVLRLPRLASRRAERLWICRDRLLARYHEHPRDGEGGELALGRGADRRNPSRSR